MNIIVIKTNLFLRSVYREREKQKLSSFANFTRGRLSVAGFRRQAIYKYAINNTAVVSTGRFDDPRLRIMP